MSTMADDELSAGQVGWMWRTLQGGIPKATIVLRHYEMSMSIYWEGAEGTSRDRLSGEVWSEP